MAEKLQRQHCGSTAPHRPRLKCGLRRSSGFKPVAITCSTTSAGDHAADPAKTTERIGAAQNDRQHRQQQIRVA